jgi:hypothetical protein
MKIILLVASFVSFSMASIIAGNQQCLIAGNWQCQSVGCVAPTITRHTTLTQKVGDTIKIGHVITGDTSDSTKTIGVTYDAVSMIDFDAKDTVQVICKSKSIVFGIAVRTWGCQATKDSSTCFDSISVTGGTPVYSGSPYTDTVGKACSHTINNFTDIDSVTGNIDNGWTLNKTTGEITSPPTDTKAASNYKIIAWRKEYKEDSVTISLTAVWDTSKIDSVVTVIGGTAGNHIDTAYYGDTLGDKGYFPRKLITLTLDSDTIDTISTSTSLIVFVIPDTTAIGWYTSHVTDTNGAVDSCDSFYIAGARIPTYTLTFVASNGTVTPSAGAHVYDSGQLINISATLNPGWVFAVPKWTITGGLLDGDSTHYTVTSTATVTVNYTEKQFTLIVNGGTPEGVTNPTAGPHVYDSAASVPLGIPIPPVGYSFDKWVIVSGDLVLDVDSTHVEVDGDGTLRADWTKINQWVWNGGHVTSGKWSEPLNWVLNSGYPIALTDTALFNATSSDPCSSDVGLDLNKILVTNDYSGNIKIANDVICKIMKNDGTGEFDISGVKISIGDTLHIASSVTTTYSCSLYVSNGSIIDIDVPSFQGLSSLELGAGASIKNEGAEDLTISGNKNLLILGNNAALNTTSGIVLNSQDNDTIIKYGNNCTFDGSGNYNFRMDSENDTMFIPGITYTGTGVLDIEPSLNNYENIHSKLTGSLIWPTNVRVFAQSTVFGTHYTSFYSNGKNISCDVFYNGSPRGELLVYLIGSVITCRKYDGLTGRVTGTIQNTHFICSESFAVSDTYTLSMTNSQLDFSGGSLLYTLENTSGSKDFGAGNKITVTPEGTLTITGFKIGGTSGHPDTLRSGTPGSAATVTKPKDTIPYFFIVDIISTNGTYLPATSTSGGNNQHVYSLSYTGVTKDVSTGIVGTVVTFTGPGFVGACWVKFGTDSSALTVASYTSASKAIPIGLAPGVYAVTVGNSDGDQTSVGNFTVESAPSTGSARNKKYRFNTDDFRF